MPYTVRPSTFAGSALLLATVLTLSGCDSPEERLERHFLRGTELADAGEHLKAILEFRNVLKIDPDHVPSLFGIALALRETGDLPAAVAHLTRVIEADRDHLGARVNLAQVLLIAGDVGAARLHAHAAYDRAPQNPDVLAIRAAVALRLGDREQALDDAYLALALAPEHTDAGTVLIAERALEGDVRAALELADRFLRSAPENLPLNFVRLQLLGLDDTRQAEFVRHLEHMIALFPAEHRLRVALAEFHHRNGDNARAVAEMRKLVALDPADTETALQLVNLLVSTGDAAGARTELDGLISTAKDAERALPFHLTLAQLDVADGKPEAAGQRLDRLIEESGLPGARIARARLHLADGGRDEARALIEQVIQDDARNVDALALRAALQLDDGDAESAIVTLRTGLAEAPTRVDLLRLSAAAHERVGNANLAGDNLAAAVRVSDHAPEQAIAHARFLLDRNRAAAAAAVLDEALRKHPTDATLLAAAAEIRIRQAEWQEAERLAARLSAVDGERGGGLGASIMAAALRGQDRPGEAIQLLKPLAAGSDGRPAALVQLVGSYVQAGLADEAVHMVDGELAANPKNATALVLRAALHAANGETDAARARLATAVEQAPQAPETWLALARFHGSQDELDQAQAVLTRAVAAVPSAASFDVRMALAGVSELRGDFDGAIGIYQELSAEWPDSLVVANNLASLLAEHRADDPASVELATRLARRLADSPVPQFQDTFGWIQHLNGNHDRALESLLKASKALPDNPWLHFHLGQTYAALGQNGKAREHLGRARETGGDTFPRLAELDRALGAAQAVQAE